MAQRCYNLAMLRALLILGLLSFAVTAACLDGGKVEVDAGYDGFTPVAAPPYRCSVLTE